MEQVNTLKAEREVMEQEIKEAQCDMCRCWVLAPCTPGNFVMHFVLGGVIERQHRNGGGWWGEELGRFKRKKNTSRIKQCNDYVLTWKVLKLLFCIAQLPRLVSGFSPGFESCLVRGGIINWTCSPNPPHPTPLPTCKCTAKHPRKVIGVHLKMSKIQKWFLHIYNNL